jgi:hypothetical protein
MISEYHLSLARDPFEIHFFEKVQFQFILFDIKIVRLNPTERCCA